MKMISKLLLSGVAAVTAAAGANAATLVSSQDYGFTDYVGVVDKVITFDEVVKTYTITGAAALVQGNVLNTSAAPATSSSTFDSTFYLAGQPTATALAAGTLSGFGTYNLVSLYWGSIDAENTLELLSGGQVVGSITGAMASVSPTGNQSVPITNRRVTISSDQSFDALRFTTGKIAFEVDNIAFLSAVPEPASWAMMVGGFGLMGAALRRKRSAALFA